MGLIDVVFACVLRQVERKGGVRQDKPVVRRKSELPRDLATMKALESFKRPDDYLTSNKESGS